MVEDGVGAVKPRMLDGRQQDHFGNGDETEGAQSGHLARALGHEHVTSQGKGRRVGRIEVQMQDSSGDTCQNAPGAGCHARASHHGYESGVWAVRCNLDSRYARQANLLVLLACQRGVEKILRRVWRSALVIYGIPSDNRPGPCPRPDIVPFLFRCKRISSHDANGSRQSAPLRLGWTE